MVRTSKPKISLPAFFNECSTGSASDLDPFDDIPQEPEHKHRSEKQKDPQPESVHDTPRATPAHMICPLRSPALGGSSSSLSSDSDDDHASSVYSDGFRVKLGSNGNSSGSSSSSGSDDKNSSDSDHEQKSKHPSPTSLKHPDPTIKRPSTTARKQLADNSHKHSVNHTQEQLHNVLAEMTMTSRDIDHKMQLLSPLMSPPPSQIIPHSTTSPHKPLSATTSPQNHLPQYTRKQDPHHIKGAKHVPYKATEKQDDFTLLQELQNRIVQTIQTRDIEVIQQVVNLISETDHYTIDGSMFDFDLCSLDPITVHKLMSVMQIMAN